jgi:hypothetical protein
VAVEEGLRNRKWISYAGLIACIRREAVQESQLKAIEELININVNYSLQLTFAIFRKSRTVKNAGPLSFHRKEATVFFRADMGTFSF